MPGICCIALKRVASIAALVIALGCGIAVAQVPDQPQQGAPHTGLIKTAIFTRVYGKPTIPHIVKLIGESPSQEPAPRRPAARPVTRRVSSMPVIGRVSMQSGQLLPPLSTMPNVLQQPNVIQQPDRRLGQASSGQPVPGSTASGELLPPRSAPAQEHPTPPATNSLRDVIQATDDVISPNYGHRTFSYHDPWYAGTVAGSYPPTFFASYPSYYAGFSPASFYGPWYGGYGAGYSPYTAYAPYSFGYGPFSWGGYPWFPGYSGYLGAFGSWYGYRPWAYPSYFTGLFGPTNYAMPPFTYGPGMPYGYGPGIPFGQSGYGGCYYW